MYIYAYTTFLNDEAHETAQLNLWNVNPANGTRADAFSQFVYTFSPIGQSFTFSEGGAISNVLSLNCCNVSVVVPTTELKME